jgi:Zn-finger nucleic acid-binding protein
MELTCPKCRGGMRSYERNGIVVDQCDDCRGIFLDRGELEMLLDAEARYDTTSRVPASLPAAASDGPEHTYPPAERRPPLRLVPPPSEQAPSWTDDDAYNGEATFDSRYDPLVPRRRSSFLQQLFD